MYCSSKDIRRFVSSSRMFGVVTPCIKGYFYSHTDKEPHSLPGYRKVPEAPNKDLTQGQAAPLICSRHKTLNAMSKPCSPSESSPQPCPARSIINKLLLTDDLDELRHRLSHDFMQLLTGEPDEMERNRIMSDFNNIDLILETLERERK